MNYWLAKFRKIGGFVGVVGLVSWKAFQQGTHFMNCQWFALAGLAQTNDKVTPSGVC